MICGSVPVLSDMKTIVERAGFTEGSHSQPGSFVIERAFVG
jgi:ferredoxin--NADP+ reductase